MSDFSVILETVSIDVTLDSGLTEIAASIEQAAPINVAVLGAPAFNLQLVTSPINVTTGLAGGGVPGPRGPRGASFLGAYIGQVNLPPIDGTNITNGDFAITSDGEIWRVQ